MKQEVTAQRPARSVIRYQRQAKACPTCGKRSFRTKRKALRVAEKSKAEMQGTGLTPYKCRHCGLWHLTSQNSGKPKAVRKATDWQWPERKVGPVGRVHLARLP